MKSSYFMPLVILFFLFPYFIAANDIYVGMSSALTGATGFLGREMKVGIEAAFHEINNAGGINNNHIKLVAMDDKYEPFYTDLNMKRFADDQNFIAVIGNVGTPTAKVALPIVERYELPFIGALSGSNILRGGEVEQYIINYRASYDEEINNMISALFEAGIDIDELAFFTQDDDYGDSGYLGLIKSLNLLNVDISKIQNIPHGRYIRNTVYVEEGLKTIIDSKKNIKAFIMVGTYQPVAKFIKLAKEHFPSAYFLGVSFVGDEALKHELCLNNDFLCHEYTNNVIITRVIPYLEDDSIPIVNKYSKALKNYLVSISMENNDNLADFERKPNSISFEGYIVGKMFIAALEKAGKQPTRKGLLQAFNGFGHFDLGLGYTLNISQDNHQASSAVFPIILKQRRISSFDWSDIMDKEELKSSLTSFSKIAS